MISKAGGGQVGSKKFKNVYETLDSAYSVQRGVVKIYKNNTLIHELAKFLVCWEEMNNGNDVITEAIFKNGCRADVYLPEKELAIEIVNTETDASIEKKETIYPCEVIFLNADAVVKHWSKHF